MRYLSTRGKADLIPFSQVVLNGLAPDGGLYLPERLPRFDERELAALVDLPYEELALRVMLPFVGEDFSEEELRDMLSLAYADFDDREIVPLKRLSADGEEDRNEYVLELFHGPTLAFKDIALQFLGVVIDRLLRRKNKRAVALGATSGDTGSAAIWACRDYPSIDIFMLHPRGRVSEFQRRQMTTVLADHVHNFAVEGTFDDCQAIVKQCFMQRDFLPEKRLLIAVNSINWGRVLAQLPYYFKAALTLCADSSNPRPVFSVPTGNFGNIYAASLAVRMGAPIGGLVIATNKNDILSRCINDNRYEKSMTLRSLAPSMDISVPSNFERLLFDLNLGDAEAVSDFLRRFAAGGVSLPQAAYVKARELFEAGAVSDEALCQTMAETYARCGYLLDPHSAVALCAGRRLHSEAAQPLVVAATAHAIKFPDAIRASGLSHSPSYPPHVGDLMAREERCEDVPNDWQRVRDLICERV